MGEIITYCNSYYHKLFIRDQAELDEFNANHLYSPFLWGRGICPEDHPVFFDAVVQASCADDAQSADISLVLKCLTVTGEEFIGVARYRSFHCNLGISQSLSIVPIPANCCDVFCLFNR